MKLLIHTRSFRKITNYFFHQRHENNKYYFHIFLEKVGQFGIIFSFKLIVPKCFFELIDFEYD